MQPNIIHILNGDALKYQFPSELTGKVIIARECLIDGNVLGDNLSALFANRAKFISQHYEGCSEQGYFQNTVSELEKILDLPKGSEVNLWFEQDLFCQVNCWFVMHLLEVGGFLGEVHLVMPTASIEWGFGGMSEQELMAAYQNRMTLSVKVWTEIGKFWKLYQAQNIEQMIYLAASFEAYPFLLTAVQAYEDSLPQHGFLGRPTESLLSIMRDLDTEEFEPVFREFTKKEAIYGFGDLQVKRLWEELRS